MENIKTVTLQAGETVLLKAENAIIKEVKKPKRNTQKERAWEKEKYHRFTFLIDKLQADKFIELLGDVRPLDWFREQINNVLNDTNTNTLNDTNTNTLNDTNTNTLNDTNTNTLNDTNTNTLNDTNTSTLNDTNTSTLNDTNTSTLNDTNTSTLNDTNTNTLNVDVKKKLSRKPTPTQEIVKHWYELNSIGLSFSEIAKRPDGYTYEKSTIGKAVRDYKKIK